jgi:hypothetical protein
MLYLLTCPTSKNRLLGFVCDEQGGTRSDAYDLLTERSCQQCILLWAAAPSS